MLDKVIQVLRGTTCSNNQSELCKFNRSFLSLWYLFNLVLLCFWVLCLLIFFLFCFYDEVKRKKEMQVEEAFKCHSENWGKGNAIHHALFGFVLSLLTLILFF